MIADNQLVNAQRTNYNRMSIEVNNSSTLVYYSRTYQNDNIHCSCGTDTTCAHEVGIYCSFEYCFNESRPTMIVPGLQFGCLPIDSVLSSTIECLYNQSCVQMLIDFRTFDMYMVLPFTKKITALNSNVQSRFFPDTKLNTIISQLLIEEWINTTDALAHYEQCKPNACTYTYTGRYNTFYMITSLLGLLGGLNIVLRLTVPFIIKIIVKLRRRLLREALPFSKFISLSINECSVPLTYV